MSDETKIFTKNDKNGDKCASGGQESGLKLIFERGVAILVRPWRFPGQPKKFVFFSIKVGTINSGTSLDSREQFKKTGKLEIGKLGWYEQNSVVEPVCAHCRICLHGSFETGSTGEVSAAGMDERYESAAF